MSSDEIRVPVKTWLKPAAYRAVRRIADANHLTVSEVIVECVRRQLSGIDPSVKVRAAKPKPSRQVRPWTAHEDAEFGRLYARGWSDNRIAQSIGRSQGTVSRKRRQMGLPALFQGRTPGSSEVAS